MRKTEKKEVAERRINIAIERLVQGLIVFAAAVAAFCGAWWQLFWVVAFVPLWAVMHRENYGSFRRGLLGWLLEFFLVIRISGGGSCVRILKYNPLTLVVFCVAGVILFTTKSIKTIKDELFAAKN
jgi:hypothetical protein